jgi:hypothetical protein
VSALQLVFGHMQGSSESVHDLAPLATLLEVNTTGIVYNFDSLVHTCEQTSKVTQNYPIVDYKSC